MCPAYDSEISFLTGVDDGNKVASTSFFTWNGNSPATYGTTSSAIKWGGSTPGTPGGNVTYSFQAASNWTSDEQGVWKAGFGLWSAIANITFSEAADPSAANITLVRGTDGEAYASFGPHPDNPVGSSTVATPSSTGPLISIDTDIFGPLGLPLKDQGGLPYLTIMREIGHILGLGNGGPYGSDPEANQFGVYDSQLWTAMSVVPPGDRTATYFGDYPVTDTSWGTIKQDNVVYDNQPLTPMMLDILAIQRLYGAPASTPFDGNEVFGFHSTVTGDIGQFYNFELNTNAIATLWDSGTNNTLDLSGFSENAVVSLAPGTFSSVAGHINNLGIAFGTVIETAIGGKGDDQITASDVSSKLKGGEGNDLLIGGAGDDDLKGEAGNDVLRGGTGVDRLEGGSGKDSYEFGLTGANGDTVVDFSGVGGDGDKLLFYGYGSAASGATFTQVDATHWSINSSDGTVHNVVTFSNAPTIVAADYAFLPTYSVLEHSGYLDFTGYRLTGDTSVAQAYDMDSADISLATDAFMNVAIVLERSQDPTALLDQGWGTRQQTLKQLDDAGTLWTTYGADQATYTEVRRALKDDYGLTILDDSNGSTRGHYVSSAESRTIWVQIDSAEQFSNLFHTTLYRYDGSNGDFRYWNGNLSLPDEWNVAGLWIDKENSPNAKPLVGGTQTLNPGPQGIGNASPEQPGVDPQKVASMYAFPLNGSTVATGEVGLIEPGIGSALPDTETRSFQTLLDDYLVHVNVTGSPTVTTQGSDGQSWDKQSGSAPERSMDVGLVAAFNPNGDIRLYTGSGTNGYAGSTIFTSLQSSIWDGHDGPAVVSSSFSDDQSSDPRSPFYRAYAELYVDAALRNISTFKAIGDGGSGNETANGLTNLFYNAMSPYSVLVAGTSISSSTQAGRDPTLVDAYLQPALDGQMDVIWRLVAGGLKTLPTSAADIPYFIETVWNQYYLTDDDTIEAYVKGGFSSEAYQNNWTSSGGVDPTRPTPWYQDAYGLEPVSSDPWHQSGRGVPDVAALAGGNLWFKEPVGNMASYDTYGGGTSAASPTWASLAAQINTVFQDQGLPNLGYMTDLLYVAAAIAPASFNDVSVGGNTSSFFYDPSGPYDSGGKVQPTGYGYEADYGYDYVSGLGSPNGVVLARSLTAIAQAEMYSTAPSVVTIVDQHGGTSTTAQTLLVQNNYIRTSDVHVQVDGTAAVDMDSNSQYGWTSRLAGQATQGHDFDSSLMPLLDGAAKSVPYEITVAAGAALGVSADGHRLDLYQALLTNDYGFVQFGDEHGGITLARPVAIAQTAGGAVDQDAVVRIRQNGGDATKLEIYKVDDLNGTVKGAAPGDANYEHEAMTQRYSLVGGGEVIDGPGQGNFKQVEITGVNPGDYVALKYTNVTTNSVYWAFSQANPDHASAIYSYGLNIFGFEDRPTTGDHDFQDLVVALDFVSTSGHQLLLG